MSRSDRGDILRCGMGAPLCLRHLPPEGGEKITSTDPFGRCAFFAYAVAISGSMKLSFSNSPSTIGLASSFIQSSSSVE